MYTTVQYVLDVHDVLDVHCTVEYEGSFSSTDNEVYCACGDSEVTGIVNISQSSMCVADPFLR